MAGVGLLPGVDETRVIYGAPAEVLDAGDIGRLLVEAAHALDGEAFKGLAIAAAVGQHIEEGEEGGEAGAADGLEEVIGERGATVGGSDGGDGEDIEGMIVEVRSEVPAVEAALFRTELGNAIGIRKVRRTMLWPACM